MYTYSSPQFYVNEFIDLRTKSTDVYTEVHKFMYMIPQFLVHESTGLPRVLI